MVEIKASIRYGGEIRMLYYQNNNWYENKESNVRPGPRTTNGKSKDVKTIEVNERYDLK